MEEKVWEGEERGMKGDTIQFLGCIESRFEEGMNQCEGRSGRSVVCMRAQHDCGEMNDSWMGDRIPSEAFWRHHSEQDMGYRRINHVSDCLYGGFFPYPRFP